ncbi:Gfo/Idh/MocA family protein [Flagellimonas algicola]|uniref:Gfo/Idh/MocA family oxidoreductase n=1 Tax=Flagellimonas algicola TaxID=2583815 RepID=A0ABY2WRJ6_9FLAO|nr:Gfo/Idh/MocA family oxidoreductase [Allomuricauda algicola]TMU57337.1 Gfo/Idh/MocA family oxidoreductase [Allomuricauda algicola]
MKTSRRSFVKKSSSAAAAAFLLPNFSIGKPGVSANSKLNIALIGAGGIAAQAYKGFENENIVALCDIDSRQFPAHMAGTPAFNDFRVMLDKMGKDIDAVCVNTPDHTHFVATMDAMQRGKHVFTQKPLTHNIWQARTLKKAKDRYKVVTNMGNQGHTYDGIRAMREWYEADMFGQVREVHMGHPGPKFESKYFARPSQIPPKKQRVPKEVNWKLWLGPNKKTNYNEIYHPLSWRGFYEFGLGQLGDWFCHIGDGPVWILDLYEPTVVECVERGPSMEGMLPDYSVVRWDFPVRGNKAPCSMYWYDGIANGGPSLKQPEEWDMEERKSGSFWYGDKQNAFLDERSNNPRLATRKSDEIFKENVIIKEKYPRVEMGPHKEWVNAIKNGGPEPGSNFDYAAPMTEVALIGVLAQRFGGKIEWDAKNMRITNRPELNAYIKEPVRRGWEYGEDLW